ncbi:MAG TPA: monovalent cation/H+ antiporter subunit A [Gemmatimonadaceae bacterium]
MILLAIVLLPILGSLPVAVLARHDRARGAWAAAVPAASSLGLLILMVPRVFAGDVLYAHWPWVPSAGLDVTLQLDGLAWLFALIVLGIGLLVILYANYYLSEQESTGRFYGLLLAFMSAMLGLALSGNLLLMAVCWELTSLISFLLIGYRSGDAAARRGARLALVVTSGGGLALLGGLILIGRIVGSFDLVDVLRSRDVLITHPLHVPALVLVLLGVFTKSAQFPFHFWLPRAMAAPTPASAYLHSATLVNAGVFLLARFYPILSGTDQWRLIVSAVGAITLVFGAYEALSKHDLKELLAYSTISHLGLITLLFGFSTRAAAVGAVFHIVNHAVFKASLFMATGVIERETGTRDMQVLNGLWRYMPLTGALAIVAAGAMAGVPFLNGFLSKELFFAESITAGLQGVWWWVDPVIATVAGALSVAYALRFIRNVFFVGPGTGMPRTPHEPAPWVRIPGYVLALLCLVIGIAPATIIGPALAVAAGAVLQGPLPEYRLAIWHGFNLTLLMTGVALAGGVGVYAERYRIRSLHARILPDPAEPLYDRVPAWLTRTAVAVTTGMENGSLQRYLAVLVLTALVAAGAPVWEYGMPSGALAVEWPDVASITVAGLLAVAVAATVVWHRRPFVALMAISAVGSMVALAFVRLSAPDLALTQVLVEVVTLLALLLVLHLLPVAQPTRTTVRRLARDAALAGTMGLGGAALAWAVLTRPSNNISPYFTEHALSGAGGANVVNAIIVDFRGFDTVIEISVLGVAALGIGAMLASMSGRVAHARIRARFSRDQFPFTFAMLSRPLLSLMLLMSAFLLLRGHNLPGGGFVAALLTAVALILQYLASGSRWAHRRRRLAFRSLLAIGVLVAVATGAGSWLVGRPFLTSAHGDIHVPLIGDIALGSALVFDTGVYLAVVGAVLLILVNLGRLGPGGATFDAAPGEEGDPWKP